MEYLQLTSQDIELEESLLNVYSEAILRLPEGRLNFKKINGNVYYYLVDAENKQHYIKKKDRDLVYLLKYKKMLQTTVDILKCNLTIQKQLIKLYQKYDPASLQQKLPAAYRDMPTSLYTGGHLYPQLEQWENDESKDSFEEEPKQTTSFGLKVRSKSEVLIAELLHAAKIPFKYENPLYLKDETGRIIKYRPDFTFMTDLGTKIYWEHLGLMDRKKYREKTFKKLTDYYHNDIILPDNLILTMETASGAIDVAAIDRVIKGQLRPLFQ